MKFQKNYTIENQSFEDFILLSFVLTDDFYESVAPNSVKLRPNVEKSLLSDSEIITIAICGELLGIDSEKAWFNFVKKIIGIFFRKCVTVHVSIVLAKISSYLKDEFLIADSFPLVF